MKKLYTLLSAIVCCIIFSCAPLSSEAQDNNIKYKKDPGHPLIFVDLVNISYEELLEVDPNTIATLVGHNDDEVSQKYGEFGQDGVLFIESKKHVYNNSICKMKKLKPEVGSIIENHSESDIQFFVNNQNLYDEYIFTLAEIDWDEVEKIEIIHHNDMIDIYQINDKKVGINIFMKD